MKLDPATTQSEIEALLRKQSEAVYGSDRTQELSGQIEHLSKMLTEVGHRKLNLTSSPPDTSGISNVSGR